MSQPPTKCPNCGALVELPPPAAQAFNVPCKYCQHNILVPPLPPPPVQPPARNPYAGMQVPMVRPPMAPVVVRTGGSWIGLIVLLGVLVPALVPLMIIGGQRGCSLKTLFSKNPFPLTCGLNEHIDLDGKEGDLKEPLIIAEVNCHVSIKNSKLKGTTIVKVNGPNVEIHLENTTMDASKVAIDGGDNLVVTLEKNSKIESKRSAIVSGANPKISLDDSSKIKSGEIALDVGYNAEVTLDGGSIEGAESAVKCAGNIKLKADSKASFKSDRVVLDLGGNANASLVGGSEVKGGTVGIKGGTNAHVTIKDSEVKAKETALDLGDWNTELTLRNAKIKGAQKIGENAKIDKE